MIFSLYSYQILFPDFWVRYVLTAFLMLSVSLGYSQKVLYLEDGTDPKPKKIYEGQKVEVKLKGYADDWVEIKIEELMPQYRYIISDRGLMSMDEITHVRIKKRTTLHSIQPTGLVYIVAAIVKRLFKNYINYDTYKLNRRYRLSMMDLTLPDPKRYDHIPRL